MSTDELTTASHALSWLRAFLTALRSSGNLYVTGAQTVAPLRTGVLTGITVVQRPGLGSAVFRRALRAG
jgi:hypothetical protein